MTKISTFFCSKMTLVTAGREGGSINYSKKSLPYPLSVVDQNSQICFKNLKHARKKITKQTKNFILL